MDGEDGDDLESSAAASEILPPILVLLPSLKSSDVNESAAAASEMVTLTNNTSAEEDTLVGRSGALEVLGQVICKGNEEGKIAAASALANLIANSDANKKSIMASPDVIPAILNLAILSEKGAAVSARALLNLVSSKEAVLLLCKIEGAIDKIGRLVLTGRMDTKEDATRLLDRMVAQVFLSSTCPPRAFSRLRSPLLCHRRCCPCLSRAGLPAVTVIAPRARMHAYTSPSMNKCCTRSSRSRGRTIALVMLGFGAYRLSRYGSCLATV